MSGFELDRQQAQANNNFSGNSGIEQVAGVISTTTGGMLLGGGISGMNNVEAKTPEDAIASIYVSEKYMFITTKDILYAGEAGIGLALAVSGLFLIVRGRRK